MKRIAIHLRNYKFKEIDCRNVTDGNPGIGGTHYATLLLADALTKSNKYDILLFAESTANLPSNIKCIAVNDDNLTETLIDERIDLIISTKTDKSTITPDFIKKIPKSIYVIIWCHCFIKYKDLELYDCTNNIKRVVFVGKEHLLKYCDHHIYHKASYIYNIYNPIHIKEKRDFKNNNCVVYIGSIVPLKGLHLLTKAWPQIIEKVPDAKLYVIGSGKLYNQNSKLGKNGIAEYFYEKKLLAPIMTKDGNIMPSVKFCGILGQEKDKIIEQCKVGVPNPSGKTETFGYTALELQDAGAFVITKKCPGYVETVFNWEKHLYNNEKYLAEYIIKSLKADNFHKNKEEEYDWGKFSSIEISNEWMKIIDSILNDNEIPLCPLTSELDLTRLIIRYKRIRKHVRFLPSSALINDIMGPIKYFTEKLISFPDTAAKIWKRYIIVKFKNNSTEKTL